MNRFSKFLIKKLPNIRFDNSYKNYDDEILKKSNLIWEKEKEINPHIYNNKIICLKSYKNDSMICEEIDYKIFVAQYRDLELRKMINILPLGVAAITLIGDLFIIGKRSTKVFLNPNHYENAPTGSIENDVIDNDHMDVTAQILKELFEEVGFSKDHVQEIKPIALAKDSQNNYVDLYFKILIDPKFVDLLNKTNPEYDSILLLSKNELKDHLKKNPYVPLSKYMLENYLNDQF